MGRPARNLAVLLGLLEDRGLVRANTVRAVGVLDRFEVRHWVVGIGLQTRVADDALGLGHDRHLVVPQSLPYR